MHLRSTAALPRFPQQKSKFQHARDDNNSEQDLKHHQKHKFPLREAASHALMFTIRTAQEQRPRPSFLRRNRTVEGYDTSSPHPIALWSYGRPFNRGSRLQKELVHAQRSDDALLGFDVIYGALQRSG